MIVVSDLVGTISTAPPTLGLVHWVRHNQSATRANIFMARVVVRYLPVKLGIKEMRGFGEWSMRAALPLVKDPTEEMVREMSDWSVDKVIWPKRRQKVLDRLTDHKQRGDDLVIASSVFEPTVESLGRRIGARAVGSPIEITQNGLQFIDLIEGSRKSEEVLRRLDVDRLGAAYGDTWVDIPILERAEQPVAVHPDAKLRAAAVERGWEILE